MFLKRNEALVRLTAMLAHAVQNIVVMATIAIF